MHSRELWGRFWKTRAARIVAAYSATAWGVFEILDKTVRTFGWPEVAGALERPDLLENQAVVLQEIRRRADRVDPRPSKRALFYNVLARGMTSEALDLLEDPGMVGFWPEAVYRSTQRGIRLPHDLVLEATDVYGEYAGATAWFYGGAMAVDEERWSDVSFAVDRLLEESRALEEQGDAFGAREHSVVAGILDQYARLRTNPSSERAVELESHRLLGAGSSEWARMVDETARWWLGEVWLDLGDRNQAARYFRSLWRDPWARDRLREIEAMGSCDAPSGRLATLPVTPD